MFTHLHWHSQYSLLEAIGSTKGILARLKEVESVTAPLMDYNGMYNAINHFQLCKKEGLKPIIWVELWVQVTTQGKSMSRTRFVTFVAKNYDGYLSLLDIVSRAHTSNKNGYPHLQLSYFPETAWNIIAYVHGYESPFGDMIQAWRTLEDITHTIMSYEEVLGKWNVIIEVIPQDPKENPLLAQANRVLRQIHENTWLPIICASNFHYINQDDQEAYDIARCIKDGKRVYDEDRRKTQGEFSIMSEEDIRTACEKNGFVESQIDEMVATTEKVADMIDLQIPLWNILFPEYDSPEDIKELYAKFQGL